MTLKIMDNFIGGSIKPKNLKKYGLIEASLIDTEENRIQDAVKKRLDFFNSLGIDKV